MRESHAEKVLHSLVILSLLLLVFDGSSMKLGVMAALALVAVVVLLS